MPAMPLTPIATAGPLTPAAPAASPHAAGFGAKLEARLALRRAGPPPRPQRALPEALRAVEAAQARLDGVLAAARAGRTFTAGELLALQAEAYRFTQVLDVAGKVVEQGVQGLKQAVHTPL